MRLTCASERNNRKTYGLDQIRTSSDSQAALKYFISPKPSLSCDIKREREKNDFSILVALECNIVSALQSLRISVTSLKKSSHLIAPQHRLNIINIKQSQTPAENSIHEAGLLSLTSGSQPRYICSE